MKTITFFNGTKNETVIGSIEKTGVDRYVVIEDATGFEIDLHKSDVVRVVEKFTVSAFEYDYSKLIKSFTASLLLDRFNNKVKFLEDDFGGTYVMKWQSLKKDTRGDYAYLYGGKTHVIFNK